jgi:hypothetical protein
MGDTFPVSYNPVQMSYSRGEQGMDAPWIVVEATIQKIELERGSERRELPRPANLAARAMFMQIRPGQSIPDDLIHFIQTVDVTA